MDEWGRSGFTDVGEDSGDGLGVGEKRDEREWRLAGRADQGEDFIDSSQESGPLGRPGGDGVWILGFRAGRWAGWLGRWGRRGRRKGKRGIGGLKGEGVVVVGPGRDQRSQGRVGSEDAMVAVTVDARWREDGGETVQELEGGETEGSAAGGVGLGEEIENLVGAATDEVETVEGKRWPGAIPNQPFQPLPVGGLDADAGIEAEPTSVIPGEHVFGLVGFQEVVTAKVAEHPFTDGVLEVLQELGGEGGGFVETEVISGFGRVLVRFTLDTFEEPVHDAEMEMRVGIEAGAEAVEKAHGAHGRRPPQHGRPSASSARRETERVLRPPGWFPI